MASIEDHWREATQGLDEAASESWLVRVQEAYGDAKRTYHNLETLGEKLAAYAEARDCLKNPRAMLLAIFFQNLDYDPKALDGDPKNLDQFEAFAAEVGIEADSDLAKDTRELLEAATTNSTEAHKIDGVYGSEDAHYLLDLDMAVLGSSPDKYADYCDKIRGEYSFLSEPMYTALRLKVLQNFLQIPNIFATKEFREKYEEQARTNIKSEIELLS
ncbi:hypothetical protein TKK_0000068 [Trichogramma kaykai]